MTNGMHHTIPFIVSNVIEIIDALLLLKWASPNKIDDSNKEIKRACFLLIILNFKPSRRLVNK
ncbi:hypothetical protein GCM10022258_32770 [Aquimarina gracilis]